MGLMKGQSHIYILAVYVNAAEFVHITHIMHTDFVQKVNYQKIAKILLTLGT